MTRASQARRRWLAFGASLAVAPAAWAQSANALERIRKLGTLKVAVYKEFYPYSDDGSGIDIELAGALADAMNLKLSLLPFDADDKMSDDLRNMVWRGHYLGYGPADVMMHVPVDRVLMEQNEQVSIFAPYFREKIRVARNVETIPTWSWDALLTHKLGVDGASLSAIVALGASGGRYTANIGNYKGIEAALFALHKGDVAAVMGTRAELAAGLRKDARFAVEDVVLPGIPPNGWLVGLAVKAGETELQQAVQQAMDTLQLRGEVAQAFEKFGVAYTRP